MYNHAHLKKAQIIGQINSCFKDVENLTTPILTKEQFEKSMDSIDRFYEDSIMKSFLKQVIKDIENEPDKKDEIIKGANDQIGSFKKAIIIEGDTKRVVWVKNK